MTIADQVRSLTAQHLGIDARTVTDEARCRDDLGADSLDKFELLMAFETTFGLEIPDDDADLMPRQRCDCIHRIARGGGPHTPAGGTARLRLTALT